MAPYDQPRSLSPVRMEWLSRRIGLLYCGALMGAGSIMAAMLMGGGDPEVVVPAIAAIGVVPGIVIAQNVENFRYGRSPLLVGTLLSRLWPKEIAVLQREYEALLRWSVIEGEREQRQRDVSELRGLQNEEERILGNMQQIRTIGSDHPADWIIAAPGRLYLASGQNQELRQVRREMARLVLRVSRDPSARLAAQKALDGEWQSAVLRLAMVGVLSELAEAVDFDMATASARFANESDFAGGNLIEENGVPEVRQADPARFGEASVHDGDPRVDAVGGYLREDGTVVDGYWRGKPDHDE